MIVNGKHYRTIWLKENDNKIICVINQNKLPHQFEIIELTKFSEFITAIKEMQIRGAGLIGATAGFAMYIAIIEASKTKNFKESIIKATNELKESRPTAVNLSWAADRVIAAIENEENIEKKITIALNEAIAIANEDADFCKRIGEHGFKIIEEISKKKNGEVVNILTHCNAGWLAFVDYGTATAPIYEAAEKGIKVHVWVDETRPRNQGSQLTAWELGMNKIPHTIIADNTGGHLMQHGMVDMVIVGSDRTTKTGDVANKIGTYLKALAAKDNKIPFYVALPSSTIDWSISNGIKQIPIEQRNADEVKYVRGLSKSGAIEEILVTPADSNAANYGFDVTPSRLVTALITERGICKPEDLVQQFVEKENASLDEGVIKFNCDWKKNPAVISNIKLAEINKWRNKMFNMGFIGIYENGIGFGNISVRNKNGAGFIISGSATGGIKELSEEHYTNVTEFNLNENSCTCVGPIIASSESLSHAVIYNCSEEINAVIHIHNLNLWKKWMHKVPTTSNFNDYGTPEIANEISQLFQETNLPDIKMLVMEGHREGIIVFGKDLDEAGKVLLSFL